MSHDRSGTSASPIWFQTFADTTDTLVQLQPIMAPEVPAEWHRTDPQPEAAARASFEDSQDGQPARALVCVEVPDLQPFWAYAAWSCKKGHPGERRGNDGLGGEGHRKTCSP